MNQSNNISKSVALTVLSHVPAHLFGLLAGIFITRTLGAEGKGLYTLYQTNLSLFCTLFGFSIINSIVYYVANKRLSTERLISIIGTLVISTILLSSVALFVWINTEMKVFFLPVDKINLDVILLFLGYIFISQTIAAFTAYFQGKRNFKLVNQMVLISSFYSLLFYGLVYWMSKKYEIVIGLREILFVGLGIHLIVTLHWLYHFLKYEKLKINWSFQEDFRDFFRFTGLNHLSSVIDFFNHKLVIWIVVFYLDNWELGIYSLAVGLSQLILMFMHPLTLILESFLGGEEKKYQGAIFSRFSRIHFFIIVITCIIFWFLCPYLIPLAYGVEFESSVVVLRYLVPGIILAAHVNVFMSYFLVTNSLQVKIKVALIGIIATIVFTPYFFTTYRMNGAVAVYTISNFVMLALLFIYLRKDLNVDRNLLFITRDDINFIKNQLFKGKV